MAKVQYYGTGRRKSSIARVWLVPGEGVVTVNDRSLDEYFGLETLKVIMSSIEVTMSIIREFPTSHPSGRFQGTISAKA